MKQNETVRLNSLQDAIIYFSDKDRAFEFAKNLRWKDGIVRCPFCNSSNHWFMSSYKKWKCKNCRKQFTIKNNTFMHDSHISIDKWMCAIWIMTTFRGGISSYELGRALKISQSSAWFLSHRIRNLLSELNPELLSGVIEADETFVGGKLKNKHYKQRKHIKGRGAVGKTIVFGVRQRKGKCIAKVIPNTQEQTLCSEIVKIIKKGSNVYTDSFPAYNNLSVDYQHSSVDHSNGEYVCGDVHTNGIENIWSQLKHKVRSTHRGRISKKHLQRYIDELLFRLNNRGIDDWSRFETILRKINSKSLTYNELLDRAINKYENSSKATQKASSRRKRI